MNRLTQKCVVASTGVHLLLFVVLLVGPGFLSSNPTQVNVEPITFVPSLFVDGPPGGGNPKAGPPVALPPAPPKPAPPAPKAVEPAPPEPIKIKDSTPEDKSDTKDPDAFSEKPHKPQVSLTKVTRKRPRVNTDDSEADKAAETAARQDYERRQQIAGLIGRAATGIKVSGTGAATTVAGDAGPGGGGPAYASYAAWVLTVYDNAWVAPDDANSEDATVRVKVTVGSDGSVIDSRIVQRSGDAAVDASVQRTLDRVARSGMGKPFPSTIKDKQRTYIIPFNLKNKRGIA